MRDHNVYTKRSPHELSPYIVDDLDNLKAHLDREFGFDIFTKTRKRQYVDARRIFIAIVYEKYDLISNSVGYKSLKIITLQLLGKYIGIDHATVMHARRNFDIYMKMDEYLNDIYTRVRLLANDNVFIRIKALRREQMAVLKTLSTIEEELDALNKIKENKYYAGVKEEDQREAEEVISEDNTV